MPGIPFLSGINIGSSIIGFSHSVLLQSTSAAGLTIGTGTGIVTIGSANTGAAHINTDRPLFYFYKPVSVAGNLYANTNGVRDLGTSSIRWKTVYAIAGNFTGNITTIAPTANLHAATKKYVDDTIASSSYVLTKAKVEAVLTGTITSHTHATATTGALGLVKIGANISVAAGVISTHAPYVITKAAVEGVLTGTITTHAHNYNLYVLPTASGTVLGGVKIGSYINIVSGVISVANLPTSKITTNSSARFITDAERTSWNAKGTMSSWIVKAGSTYTVSNGNTVEFKGANGITTSMSGNVVTITAPSGASKWSTLGTLNNNLVPVTNASSYNFGTSASHNIAVINGETSFSFAANGNGSLTVMNITTSNDYYNHSPGSILTGTNCKITSDGYGHSIVGGHSNTIRNFSSIQAYNCGIVNGTGCTVSARRGLLLGCRNVTLENPNTAAATIMIGCNDTTTYNGTTWDGIIMGVKANLTADSAMPIKMGNTTVYGSVSFKDVTTNAADSSKCLTIDAGGRVKRRGDNEHEVGTAAMTTTSDYNLTNSRVHKSIDGVVTIIGDIGLNVAKNFALGSYQTIATLKPEYMPVFSQDSPGSSKISMWVLGWIINSSMQYNIQFALVAGSGDIRAYYLPTNGMTSQNSLTGSSYVFRLNFTFPTI